MRGREKKEKKKGIGRRLVSLLMTGVGAAAAVLAFLQKGALKLMLLRLWKHRREERKKARGAKRHNAPAPERKLLPDKLGVRRAGDPMPPWKSGRLYFNLSCLLEIGAVGLRITAAVLDAVQEQRR